MVVHLGVVVMALAIVTSTSYTTRNEVTLATGQSTVVSGSTSRSTVSDTLKDALETATQLRVDVEPPLAVAGDHDLQRAKGPNRSARRPSIRTSRATCT